MSKNRKDGEAIFIVSPAGMLQLTTFERSKNNQAINSIINEAFAAREMLKMIPQGDGTIGISINNNPKWAQRYGESRENTDKALRNAGKNPELGKWVDAD